MTTKSESPLCKSPAVRRIAERMSNQFGTNIHESCSPQTVRLSSVDMLTKLLRMGIIGLMLCAANAWAGPASIQGIVKTA